MGPNKKEGENKNSNFKILILFFSSFFAVGKFRNRHLSMRKSHQKTLRREFRAAFIPRPPDPLYLHILSDTPPRTHDGWMLYNCSHKAFEH